MGVMIDNDLWDMIQDYFCGDPVPDLYSDIKKAVLIKQEKQWKRMQFSAYKQAPSGSAAREQLRQEYLDSVGVLSSFRSDLEYHEEQPPF